MKKPIIGVSGSLIIDQSGMFPGYRRAYVNHDYILSIIAAGGVPYILPFSEDLSIIKDQIELLDGLILSGGHDVAPVNYGAEPSTRLGEIFPERDAFDMAVIEAAEAKELPILGICRGAQILNVYHGGTICQDLAEYKGGETIKHNQGHTPYLESHSVKITKGSKIHSIFQEEETRINSFHHQVLEDVPAKFDITGRASDGVVECIENKEYPWEVGVQWHPEMLHSTNEKMLNIFKALVVEAAK